MTLKEFLNTIFLNHVFFCFITLCSLYLTDIIQDFYMLDESSQIPKDNKNDEFGISSIQNIIFGIDSAKLFNKANVDSSFSKINSPDTNKNNSENTNHNSNIISSDSNEEKKKDTSNSLMNEPKQTFNNSNSQTDKNKNSNENFENDDNDYLDYNKSEQQQISNEIAKFRRSEWHKYLFHLILTPALFVDAIYSIEIQKILYKEQKCFLHKTANNLNFIEHKRYTNKIYFFSQFVIVLYLAYCLSVVLFIEGQLEEIVKSIINFTQPNIDSGLSFYVRNLSNSAIGCVFLTLFFGLVDQGVIVEKFYSLFDFTNIWPNWYGAS